MRWQFKITIVLVFGFVLMGLALGQQPLQISNIRTLFGKDGKSDPIGLLKTKDVRRELNLTDEQLQKVDDAIWKMLAENLDSKQVERLMQIDLQQRDFKVFLDPKVQADLKLNEMQKNDLKTIVHEADLKIEELMKALEEGATASQGGGQNIIDKINVLRKIAKADCTDVLSDSQRRLWNEILGPDFIWSGSIKINLDDPAAKKGKNPDKTKKGKKGG